MYVWIQKLTILTSHKRFELSFELLSNNVPLEFISTDVTSPRCDWMVRIHKPETISQNFIVLSFDPVIIKLPNGLNIVFVTAD